MANQLGIRVLRGPDWDADDEDGGEGHVGTVIELLSNQRVRVLWDTGQESTCRAGTDGKFDLRVFDTAQIGVRHPNTKCKECGEQNIYGMLWRCNDCNGCDLCLLCYNGDKHDLRHQFLRIDFPGNAGHPVKKRKTSVKIRTVGMFSGAKVKRGRDWMWGEQDGGAGSEGEVKGYENVAPDSSRNLVRVQWSRGGPPNSYRVGFQGQVDLVCVEEDLGPFYYRDHLPVLDTTKPTRNSGPSAAPLPTASASVHKIYDSAAACAQNKNNRNCDSSVSSYSAGRAESSPQTSAGDAKDDHITVANVSEEEEERLLFAVGDRVAIHVGEDTLRQLQVDYGGCSEGLIKAIGETGEVTAVSDQGSVSVKYKAVFYRFNPRALAKVHHIKQGDIVRIRPDERQVKILNSKVGWKENMGATVGKVGRVLKIDSEGDVLVGFGRHFFMFSPACCIPAPGVKTDSLVLNPSTTSSGEQKTAKITGPTEKATHSPAAQESLPSVYKVLREAMGVRSGHTGVHHLLYVIQQEEYQAARAMCQADMSLLEAEESKLTPLMLACAGGHKKTVDVLLELGADVNHAIMPRRTPMAAALEGKNEDIIEEILRRGADPFFVNPKLHTYLHIACFYDLPRTIRTLAAYGLDVNAKDCDDDTPLHVAIEKKCNKAVETLLQLPGIDLTARNKYDFTPLHWAALRGNPGALELIVAKDKSQVNAFHHGKSTPLHIAANNDRDQCVRVLILNGGANVNLQDSAGASYAPLHLACIRGKFRAAEALLELGADVHVQDARGDTPLHLSIGGRDEDDLHCEAGRQETQQRIAIACMLISKGAYVDAENKSGRNPLTYGAGPLREGVKQFMKHNKDLVKRRGTVTVFSKDKIQSLDASTFQNMERGKLKEALKGVGLPCGVCGTPKSDVTLQPCQHKCVCSTCSDKVTRCLLCEERVTDKIITGPDAQTLDLQGCKQM